MKVQKWMIDAAKRANACEVPALGTPLEEVSRGHIKWALSNIKGFAIKAKLKVQDWWFGSGDGSGSGYGDGYGYGDSDGYKKAFNL